MKTISRRELITKLRGFGFDGPFSGDKHQFMIKSSLKLRIPNPHGSRDISYPLLKEILRQADISTEDWESDNA